MIGTAFQTFKSIIAQHRYFLIAALVLILYLSPNLFYPHVARFLESDNLNGRVVTNIILGKENYLFAPNNLIIPEIMGGIERVFLPSELSFMTILYAYFSPITAYNIHRILMHLMAFISMYIFAKKYLSKNLNSLSVVFISLGFATLPHFTNASLGITAQPLLLYCLLNIYHKKGSVFDWILVFIFPFFSSLVLTNIFFITAFTFAIILDMFRQKLWNTKIFIALAIFTLASCIVEYRLFIMQFGHHIVSHRAEFYRPGTLNFKGVIGTSILFFIEGHRHFPSIHFPLIILIALSTMFIAKSRLFKLQILFLLFFAYTIAFITKIYDWFLLDSIKNKIQFLHSFSIRFYSLYPLLWFIILTFCIEQIQLNKKISFITIPLLALIITTNLFMTRSLSVENSFYHTFFEKKPTSHYSFNEYYSPELFKKIKETILIPSNKYVGCIGFEPAIAQYNGIKTIGAFQNNYPLDFKKKIRKVMAKELDKNNHLKTFFDFYAPKCYLFSAELFDTRPYPEKITNLEFDIPALIDLNCEFLFSTVIIENYKELNIFPVFSFEAENQYSITPNIHVYKLSSN